MYSELMMREHGFDDGPAFRVAMHTDAIWRACRIILDVRMHRGELTVDEATDFLVEQTSFERPTPTPRSSGTRTGRPTRCRTCSAGPCCSRLRADEQRRLGDAFSPQGLPRHAAAQRVAPDQLPPPAAGRELTRRAGHPGDRPRERPLADRLLAGCRGRDRRADRPSRPDRRAVRGPWARGSSTSSTSTAPGRARRPTSTRSAPSRHGSPSRSRSPAASTPPRGSGSPSRPGRRAWC